MYLEAGANITGCELSCLSLEEGAGSSYVLFLGARLEFISTGMVTSEGTVNESRADNAKNTVHISPSW